MTLNPRRRARTDSSAEDNAAESQNNSINEILLQISDKMSTVIDKLDRIAALIMQADQNDVIKSEFKETRDAMAKGFSTIAEQAETTANLLQQQDHEKLKAKIKQWKNTLNDRKKTYWLYLKNTKFANKYDEWYNATPIKLPNKFLPKTIPGEAEEQKEIRMRHAKERMKYEIDMMKAKINNFKSQYEAIDQTLFSEIETSSNNDSTKAILRKLWMNDCKSEEAISEEAWKEKEEWLLDQEFQFEQADNNNSRQPPRETGYGNNFRNAPNQPRGNRQNENGQFRRPTYAPRDGRGNGRVGRGRGRGRYNYNENNQNSPPYHDNEEGREVEQDLQRSNSFLSKGRNRPPRF